MSHGSHAIASTGKPFAFSPENEKRFQELLPKYPTRRAVVLPALWLAQEQEGHLTVESMEYVAERLEQPAVTVFAVVEFYTMFKTEAVGKHHLQVCRTLTCTMRGCDDLQTMIERKLGIGAGEKTADGKFSVEMVECLGACGAAPVMRMDNRYWENLTVDKLERIIDACREGRDPASEDFDR
ncbi:MAG TPA: NAD(P)H-dependent oxidoreductase subunit E [Candidatus Krumholzibacteria bacterium]|nr:NAD(P)H-dependent oxidoreductase subunit E [Candidatus Krumholzibacteria bacterium]